jgi:hypothetical protein
MMATRARENSFIKFTPGKFEQAAGPSLKTFDVRGKARDQGLVELDIPDAAIQSVIEDKQIAATHVYKTLEVIGKDLTVFFPKVLATMPGAVDGTLLNPDGSTASGVIVEALQPVYSAQDKIDAANAKVSLDLASWSTPHAVTDARGTFKINLPSVPMPAAGLVLRAKGGNGEQTLEIKRVLALEGSLGTLPLDKALAPAQTSVLTQLRGIQEDIVAHSPKEVENKPEEFAAPLPQINLGEGDCGRFFRSGSGVIDKFRYSVLIRLVEPQMNQWVPLFRMQTGRGNYIPMPIPASGDSFWNATGALNAIDQIKKFGRLVLVNRTPIDRPIDVSEFHKNIEEHPVFLPKASTLGLGYIVHMHQVWIPAGLSLGDLVYSLPLAPGEQQRIAIQETVQTVSERDAETFSEDEFQTFRETQDSSAIATFRSAFDEVAQGRSHMDSSSHTANVGATASTGIIGAIFGGGGVSAGYSNSSSSGNASSWQNTSRDFASSSAQEMHAALGRVASASRRSTRTRVRMATATERTQVTTRVVTNHNKGHALTMQWWEVLRHYGVSSQVDDVQLVCFVPMELVQFLPEGQPFALTAMPGTRQALLDRYAMVSRYYDVLYGFFARNPEHAYGMRQLRDFVANPEAKPAASNAAQEIIMIALRGTVLPFEEIFVTIVGKSGARVGPLKLTASPAAYVTADLTPEKWSSRDELLGHLKDRRINGSNTTIQVAVPLPSWMARSDVVRFDFSRRFVSMSYKLKPLPIPPLQSLFDALNLVANQTVSFTPSQLEAELGGPVLRDADAILPDGTDYIVTGQTFQSGEAMPGNLPIAAVRVAPVLAFSDLLRIEAVFHHIVRNTVTYSKAVWQALTDEERAILLERFTIGVPSGGVTGADQEVPLLNCVANRVLGYFGNAAIMPFSIPPDVAGKMKVTSRDIQDALLKFHRQAFQPPRSSITLPCRGTLGEAVLGSCNSAEKIDLTRFWNWQDSPADTADAIPASVFNPPQPLQLPQGSASAGSGVGGGAGSSGSIISINSPAPSTISTSALEKLIEKSPDLAANLKDLTGLTALGAQMKEDTTSAANGRKEAIDSVTEIQKQGMKSAEKIVESVANAVASIYGGGKKGGESGGDSGGGGEGGGGTGGAGGGGGG